MRLQPACNSKDPQLHLKTFAGGDRALMSLPESYDVDS